MIVYLDYETRCRRDLRKCGVHRYVADPSFRVLVINYAIDDGPVQSVMHGDWRGLQDFIATLAEADIIVAHNAEFERVVTLSIMPQRLPVQKWRCTAALARHAGLPGALDGAVRAIGLPLEKDRRGKALIKALCMPQIDGTFKNDPDTMLELAEYGARDVELCRALFNRLPGLGEWEAGIFIYDHLLNTRGVSIDLPLLAACQRVAAITAGEIDSEIVALTSREITTVAQRNRIMDYLTDFICPAADLSRRTVKTMLDTRGLPDNIQRLLQLRSEGARTSTKKLAAIDNRRVEDKLFGMLLYYGASTGRHSSHGVQLQNLPRPERPWWMIEEAFSDILEEDIDRLRLLYGPPLSLIADMLRSLIIPEPGNVFEICDLNAVELRGAAWLAHEDHVLTTLKEGDDIYCRMAANVFSRRITKEDEKERFLGKTLQLAGQYGMGWSRFQKTCADQGVSVAEDLARRSIATYRETHPNIVHAWGVYEEAARHAINNPGKVWTAGSVAFRIERDWLLMRLPSERCIFYFKPFIAEGRLGYHGVNSYTHQFGPLTIWGGILFEHATQGMCRDVLMEGCASLEHEGHKVKLIVHDETLSEVGRHHHDIRMVEHLMSQTPEWAPGLPLAAKGLVSERYRKI